MSEDIHIRYAEALRARDALEAENATLKRERDAARRLANISGALWSEAEKEVIALTEPLQYGEMLCFTRGTLARMTEEKSELEAECDRLRQALKPFAGVLKRLHINEHEDDSLGLVLAEVWNSQIICSVGQLRAARSALSPSSTEEGG